MSKIKHCSKKYLHDPNKAVFKPIEPIAPNYTPRWSIIHTIIHCRFYRVQVGPVTFKAGPGYKDTRPIKSQNVKEKTLFYKYFRKHDIVLLNKWYFRKEEENLPYIYIYIFFEIN